MSVTRRKFMGITATAVAAVLTGCIDESQLSKDVEEAAKSGDVAAARLTGSLALNQSGWNLDSDNNVLWQMGIPYCSNPPAPEYETLGIFVPAAYFDTEKNDDGTFTCSIGEGTFAGFSAQSAPVLLLADTPDYAARREPGRYNYRSMANYLKAGFVCIQAGCRGSENGYDADGNLLFAGGAPWNVTDLKAAIRFVRYNARLVPGNVDRIFAYGQCTGGSLGAILGASGNSSLYLPYLERIGAALKDDNNERISDAIAGVISWCPTVCLDQADAAYEWQMGQYADGGTREDGLWTAALSQHLAERFAQYINEAAFTDADGTILELERTSGSIFAAGSYYDYMLELVEESLNNFLADTKFPYTVAGKPPTTPDSQSAAQSANESESVREAEKATEAGDTAETDSREAETAKPEEAEAKGKDTESETSDEPATSITFEKPEDYIASLNESEQWVSYDARSKTASIASMEAFVRACRQSSKDVGGFDMLDRSSAENVLFGTEDHDALHFDYWMAELLQAHAKEYSKLEGWKESYADDYSSDMTLTNSIGAPLAQRMDMYNPLYYLCDAYDGAGTSDVAQHWRIHSGIERTDTSLACEVNLVLALGAHDAVENVEYRTVWGRGNTQAERMGDPTENAVSWIKSLFLS